MNANELADKAESVQTWEYGTTDEWIEQAATMLRQQQAEIEALKAGKIRAYDNGVEDGRKPDTNNEPVAWMIADKEAEHIRSIMAVQHDFVPQGCVEIPLYTHPVKEQHLSLQKTEDGELVAVTYTDDEHRIVEVLWQKPPVKELTDEEIRKIYCITDGNLNMIAFARAILRKAQEK